MWHTQRVQVRLVSSQVHGSQPSQMVVMFRCGVCVLNIYEILLRMLPPLPFVCSWFCSEHYRLKSLHSSFPPQLGTWLWRKNGVVQYILLKNIYMKPSQTVVMFCCVVCAKHIWNFIAHASSPPFFRSWFCFVHCRQSLHSSFPPQLGTWLWRKMMLCSTFC